MAQTKGQISRSKANEFLTQIFYSKGTGGAYTVPNYIGLATGDPGVNCNVSAVEVTGEGYERRTLADIMATPSDGQIHNKDIIFFPESLGSWGEVKYFFIATSKTGATGIFSAPLTLSVQIPEGYVPIFRAKALIVGIDKDSLEIPS